jgi:hypothetical protein
MKKPKYSLYGRFNGRLTRLGQTFDPDFLAMTLTVE